MLQEVDNILHVHCRGLMEEFSKIFIDWQKNQAIIDNCPSMSFI